MFYLSSAVPLLLSQLLHVFSTQHENELCAHLSALEEAADRQKRIATRI